jgi:triacylglycerol lipase
VIPVVLHHGLFGFDELRVGPVRVPQFPGVEQALRRSGHATLLTRVHPCASIARRAGELKANIVQRLAEVGLAGPVVLVAHSLGGLDARYMLSHLDMSGIVAAVITISTPHRGASLADFYHHHLNHRLKIYPFIAGMLDIGAAYDLRRERFGAFNEATPDHPGVRYFSVTCSRPWWRVRARLMFSARVVARAEGENDGIVSVSSADWGTHLAHWDLDHIAATNRGAFPPLSGRHPDVATRYVEIVTRAIAATPRLAAATQHRPAAAV